MKNVFRRGGIAALGAAVLLAGGLSAAAPARAADLRERYLATTLSLCDPSGCYYAWGALDSDGDGVSNADESVAGTDPFDATSRPGLRAIKEIAGQRGLPTLEAGMGTFLVVPPEVVAMRDKDGLKVDGTAFPVGDRVSALNRLGIDSGLLKQFGIDLAGNGLTIGLGTTKGANGLPNLTPGTIDMSIIKGSLISKTPAGPVQHGGAAYRVSIDDGVATYYHDGWHADTTSTAQDPPGVSHSDWYDPDNDLVAHSKNVDTRNTHPDGSQDIHHESRSTDEAGNWSASETSDTHVAPDGSSINTTTTVVVNVDADDNVTGTTKVVTTTSTDTEGRSSTSSTTESCDKKGKNCSDPNAGGKGDYPADGGDEGTAYWDPDAVLPTPVSQQDINGVLTLKGANITVLPGWTPPGLGGRPKNPRDPSVIALFDEEHISASYVLADPLRVTRAQPEIRPDLPDPVYGPFTPPPGGPCDGLC